jgi:hypothetical protein
MSANRTPKQKAAAIAAMTTSAEAILGRKLVLGRKLGAKVPVSLRAVIQRVNRKLADEGQMGHKLKAARDSRRSAGDFYVVDIARAWIVQERVDPETLARELGALQPWEEVR